MPSRLSARDFSMVLALAAIVAFFALRSPAFLGARNLSMLVIELSITAVLALGMLLVIVPGQIDLSVGSGVGLLGGIASVLVFQHRWPAPIAMALVLVVGLVVWLGMGALIVKQKVPSFIITLGGLLVFKGLHWLVIKNATVPVAQGGETNLYSLLTTYYLPAPFGLALAAAVVLGALFARTLAWKRAATTGAPGGDGATGVMKWLVFAQAVFLFVLVANRYRGVPLAAVILSAIAWVVWVLLGDTPVRASPLRDRRERGGGTGLRDRRRQDRHHRVRRHGDDRRSHRSSPNCLRRGLDDDGRKLDGARRRGRLRDWGNQLARRARHSRRGHVRRAHHGDIAQWNDAARRGPGAEVHRSRDRPRPRRLGGRTPFTYAPLKLPARVVHYSRAGARTFRRCAKRAPLCPFGGRIAYESLSRTGLANRIFLGRIAMVKRLNFMGMGLPDGDVAKVWA